jgi:uncharacterized repeat protein (TIGR01451 family)
MAIPISYDGDVRKLPQVPFVPPPDAELPEPPNFKSLPDGTPSAPSALSAGDVSAAFGGAEFTANVAAPTATKIINGIALKDLCGGIQCGAGFPPDVNGEVGLKHYILSVNDAYGIFDKATGALISSFQENQLWAGSGATQCDGHSFGDPVVLYDQVADRWILTHFAFGVSGNSEVGPYMECIAVSKSGDPVSGGWWLYALRIDQSPIPTNVLGDYPKFGLWNDGCLYMTVNGFGNNGTVYSGVGFASLNKNDLYSGGPLTWALGWLPGNTNFALVPANLTGKSPSQWPAPGTPEWIVAESSTAFGFEIRKFTPGPSCGGGGTLSALTQFLHNSYTTTTNANPQPNDTNNAHRLDSLTDRVMQKAQYRRVGNKESIWVAHTAPSSTSLTNNSQVHWAELDVTGGVLSGIAQQQFHHPTTTLWRWMPSIAADNAGNMAVGYSTSGTTAPNFPSIQYAGRLVTDPLGTLGQTETMLLQGGGSQLNNCGGAACHRWGDYTSMSIDPVDDCTFWHANEYYPTQADGNVGNWHTAVAAFKYDSCSPIYADLSVSKGHSGDFTQGQNNAQYTITVTNQGPGFASGNVAVNDVLPFGMRAVSLSGSGWSCNVAQAKCTRNDTLAQGSSYPPINVTVWLASNLGSSTTNQVNMTSTVEAGGSNNTATDPTNITPAAVVNGTVQLVTTATLSKLGDGSYRAVVTVTNNGTGTAQNVQLTAANLGVPGGSPIPQSLGNIVPNGGWAITIVNFPASAGASGAPVAEKYSGTYTGGTFGASIRAVLP